MGDARQVQGLGLLAAAQAQHFHIIAAGNGVQVFAGEALQVQLPGVVEHLDGGKRAVRPFGFFGCHGVGLRGFFQAGAVAWDDRPVCAARGS
ncbi:hypothetical protein D3C86_2039450 [compost metagenome]